LIIADRFWNVGQANCILKYFENMMTDHSDSTIFQKMVDFPGKIHTSADVEKIPSVFMYMYAMNIQNDVIGLVLRQNCKSKQVTDIIA
jgi:hypothetical protein